MSDPNENYFPLLGGFKYCLQRPEMMVSSTSCLWGLFKGDTAKPFFFANPWVMFSLFLELSDFFWNFQTFFWEGERFTTFNAFVFWWAGVLGTRKGSFKAPLMDDIKTVSLSLQATSLNWIEGFPSTVVVCTTIWMFWLGVPPNHPF